MSGLRYPGLDRRNAWNADADHFAATFGGDELDASLTQLVDLNFLHPDDPRHRDTLKAIAKHLRRGPYLLRYDRPDDFGAPETAFNFCTFWFIEGLYLIGETDEARRLFEQMLERRNHAGLLSEDVSLTDGELWGELSPDLFACWIDQLRRAAEPPVEFREMSRLIVVSNRVSAPQARGEGPAGGLAVALSAALREYTGFWFGWSGKTVGRSMAKSTCSASTM